MPTRAKSALHFGFEFVWRSSSRIHQHTTSTASQPPSKMSLATFRIGLRQCPGRTSTLHLPSTSQVSVSTLITARQITFITRPQSLVKPLLLQSRYASTAADASIRANPKQKPSNLVLDWNNFFRLRTSRRRYSLASSVVCSIGVTGAMFMFLSTQPEMADELTKLIPLDPVISMGILTFAATFAGWLIGPVFGNTIWKLLHRSGLSEFTLKERAFFERIKKHRVNPMGASTNNPVPDYYGEKIGSVQGYRRWLKDQRAFNRKREGTYPEGI